MDIFYTIYMFKMQHIFKYWSNMSYAVSSMVNSMVTNVTKYIRVDGRSVRIMTYAKVENAELKKAL